MIGALWYLIRTSVRNRLRRQVRRLRQPRYALAFALGLLYFWFFFIRDAGGRGAAAVPAAILGVFGVLIIGYLAWAWLFGTDKTALAFSRAEVALLFPAPVSRRGLILYKLASAQFGILVSVMVWSVLLNRGGDGALSSVMRGAGLWAAMSIFSLHRLGIGLLRAGATEHGAAGAKRSIPAFAVFAAAAGLVGWTIWSHRGWLAGDLELPVLTETFLAILDLPPASIVLYPISVAFAPIAERAPGPWSVAMLQALLLLALHVWWVLGSDAAFEEAAAEASETQAKAIEALRTRRAGGAVVRPASRRRTIPLAPRGSPAIAIVWKNLLWLLRTHQLRGLLLPPALALAAALGLAGRDPKFMVMVSIISGMVGGLFLVFGPAMMRNDLRSDLLQLPMLKTLPIRGDALVRAQVLSGAIAIATPVILLLWVALLAASLARGEYAVPAELVAALAVGGPPFLLVLTAATFTLHNGVALLLPGWVRLGEKGPTGIEATGQMMLVSVGQLVAVALLLIAPVLVGGLAWFAAAGELGTAVVTALLGGALVLAGEAWLLLRGLGRAFDRIEPSQVAQ